MIQLYLKQILTGVNRLNVKAHLKIGISVCLTLCLTFSLTQGQTFFQKLLYGQELALPITKIALKTLDKDSLWTAHFNEEDNHLGRKFGAEIQSNFTLLNSGTWTLLNDSTRVWRMELSSPNAVMLSFMFKEFFIPKGGKLLIYSSDYSNLVGPYTEKNNQSTGRFASALLAGSSAVFEYYEPLNQSGAGRITIDKVIHAYTDPFESSWSKSFCHTSACDAPSEWCNQERSVGIICEGGGMLCSGVLLTNVERNYKPYFLTALHCGDHENRNMDRVLDSEDIDVISQWVVYFKNCGMPNHAIHGATVKEYRFSSDYLLLELNEQIPEAANVYYSGWNGKDVRPQEATSIHFPESKNGNKQIAFSNERPTQESDRYYIGTQTYLIRGWRLRMNDGVMEEGSSGAPLFNQQHRVVGQFSGWQSDPIQGGLFGLRYCDVPNVEVDFGRFRWTMRHGAREFLDPNGGLFNRTRSMSGDEPPCENNLLIENEPFLGNGLYEASIQVTSQNDVQIRSGRHVQYTGGNRIQIKPGFRAHSGSKFRAHIQGCHYGCDPDIFGKSEELITSVEGILFEDSIYCVNGVSGQSIWAVDDNGNTIGSVSSVTTDSEGAFMFTSGEIQALDTNMLMTFHSNHPDFNVPPSQTLRDWVLQSPIELFLTGCIAPGKTDDHDIEGIELSMDDRKVKTIIAPNPNDGNFMIFGQSLISASVSDGSGRFIDKYDSKSSSEISIKQLSAGIYIVEVLSDSNGFERFKVVVQ